MRPESVWLTLYGAHRHVLRMRSRVERTIIKVDVFLLKIIILLCFKKERDEHQKTDCAVYCSGGSVCSNTCPASS